tara:strand:+ start:196 stop:459 length:264 start_codon:yes stop_codon:yes gene_type:complete
MGVLKNIKKLESQIFLLEWEITNLESLEFLPIDYKKEFEIEENIILIRSKLDLFKSELKVEKFSLNCIKGTIASTIILVVLISIFLI